jgi:short-subunit dehydrogenase
MERLARALVTGASSGLGVEFARQLAGRGCSVVLVARRAEPMEELARELRSQYDVDAEVLAADLADAAQLGAVERRLADPERPVNLLVNNAGVGSGGTLEEVSADEQERQLRVNTVAPVRLVRAALPRMIEQRHGGVINVASMAASIPATPGSALYGAAKAFLRSYSEGLAAEVRGHGIRVVGVQPGFVRTAMTEGLQRTDPPSVVWVRADRVVAESLRALAAGRVSVVPGFQYKAADAVAQVLPRSLLRLAAGRISL